MKNSKNPQRSSFSTLTLRLWEFTGTALLTMFIWVILLIFLSPLSYMIITSLKAPEEFRDGNSPIYPAQALSYTYQGKSYELLKVPTETGVHDWALFKAGRTSSQFIDPANPAAGPITWQGSWRSLSGVYRFRLNWSNYVTLWKTIDYPHFLKNTFVIAILGEIGVLCSSIAVAYGFSRFRIPGGKFLFYLLIATIVIPDTITLVPSYVIYTRVLHWNGSYYPLVVPAFFGSAIYIFLLRQNFKSIPRDLDEAAMLDGAGPLRTLISIIIPQAVPAIVTVALLQFFNSWNELRMASLYLSIRSDLKTMAFTAQSFQAYGFTPNTLQASAVLLMVIPLVILFLSQRYFMQDMVVTGLEK
jgi:multiple sugar transport system permease protein